MKQALIILLLVVLAFLAGKHLAGKKSSPLSGNTAKNVSYQGGYDKSKDADSSGLTVVADQSIKGETIEVKPGELIQDAVKNAKAGDTILVYPGEYHETVYVDKDNIRLLGVIDKGARATLDGKGVLNDAILYSGNNFVVENFRIVRYKGNGIMGQAGNNFEIRNNVIEDAGVYGIFPQLGKNGIVEHNVVSEIADAAIYIGMSDNVHVAHNQVFESVAGIEIENSRHAIVEDNLVYNNTGGVLAFITPGLPIKTTYDVIIRNNFINDNNHVNFGAPGSLVAGIPSGTGILIMAADDVVVEGNIISNNKVAAVLITDHENSDVTFDPDSEPNPDRVAILDNVLLNNGYDTIAPVKALMLTEFKSFNPDIIKVGGGEGGCIVNRHRYKTVGIDEFVDCDFDNTDNTITYLLDKPVAPRKISPEERGKIAYLGVCAGCHSYTGVLIGPPVQTIQALYMDDPEGLAAYIANPVKKRPDYPEMPSQAYLGEATLKAVAEYMLSTEN